MQNLMKLRLSENGTAMEKLISVTWSISSMSRPWTPVSYTHLTKESSTLRQAIQNLVQRKPFLLQERNDKWVDVAAAVGLNYAHLQGDTEAGINALAVVDGTQRTAAAQVTGDSLAGGAIHIGKRLSHIAMGSAVISQALDAIFFIPLPGNAIDTSFQRDSLMESLSLIHI